jgi:outer membrane immunogenic protein
MTRLNIFAITTAVVLCSSAMPGYAQNRPAPASSLWTSCYLGGHLGGSHATSDPDDSLAPSNKMNGFIGGAQVGCDYLFATNWLVGMQGAFSGTNLRGNDIRPTGLAGFSEEFRTQTDWLASLTGRIGYIAGPWLLFGRGGFAWVRNRFEQNEINLGGGGDRFAGSTTFSGWTAGGGLEYAFAPNWSTFLEYSFYDFGKRNATLTEPGFTESLPVEQNFSVVKIGLSYRFGH